MEGVIYLRIKLAKLTSLSTSAGPIGIWDGKGLPAVLCVRQTLPARIHSNLKYDTSGMAVSRVGNVLELDKIWA